MVSSIRKKITESLLLLFFFGSLSSCINDKQENRDNSVWLHAIRDSLDKFDTAISVQRVRDPEFSLKVAGKARMMADQSGDERLKARGFLLAGIAFHQYDPDSAFFYYHKAMNAALLVGYDSIRPRILYNMAMLMKSGYNYQYAIQLLDSAIRVAEHLKDFITVSNCLNSWGNIEAELHREERARELFDKALAVVSAHRLGKQTGVAYGSIARFTKDPEEAMRLQRHALDIIKSVSGAEEEKGYILINIGESTADPDSAISYYLQAIEIARRGNIPEMEIAAYNNLAYSYLDKKNTHLAEKYLSEIAIPLARKAKITDWLPSLYDTYADILKASGNTEKAFEYQKEAYRAREESEIHKAALQTRLLSAILGEKNMKMKILEQESELVSDRSHQKFLYFTILSLLLLIVIFGLAVAGFITRKNLRIKKNELDMARRLALLEEQEKTRLSYQLHDLIRPVRAAILKRSGLAGTAGTILSGETLSELDQIYASLRRISHRMNPEIRKRHSFSELVKEICEDFAITSLHEINLSLKPEHLELTAECAGHFYFIITELLANADRHIAHGKVTIRITAELDHLYLFYNDTGPGFNTDEEAGRGLGIIHIHERARLLGGHADLSSAQSSGTEWIISVPSKGNIIPEKP